MSENYIMEGRRGTYFDVVLFIIIVLTVSFSGFTTYIGFAFDLPNVLALFLALVIGLGLFAVNLKIRDARRHGQGIGRPMIAFLLLFVFSFISNTNAIYTFFVERDIVGQTQEAAWQVFDAETNKITNTIANMPEVTDFEKRVTQLKVARRNLQQQIVDVRNPGFGELSQRHYREVKQILDVDLTPLRPPTPPAPMSQYEDYAKRLDELIMKQAESQFGNDPAGPIIALRNDINKVRAIYEKSMIHKEYDRNATDLMKRDLNSFAISANELLPSELAISEIDNASDETGSFQYTWRNFLNWISPAAIILSVLLGALLDLLAPLLSILLYRYEEVI